MISIKAPDGKSDVAHRIIYGLLVPVFPTSRLVPTGRDAFFRIHPIWHDNKEQELIFHLASMSFCPEKEFTQPPLFTLKRDLLFDLQSKAANHVNRLGNYLLQ